MLAKLNDADVELEKVQHIRREISVSIEAELEANASLHWKQFLTMGFVDNTRMKIIREVMHVLLAARDPRVDGLVVDCLL